MKFHSIETLTINLNQYRSVFLFKLYCVPQSILQPFEITNALHDWAHTLF